MNWGKTFFQEKGSVIDLCWFFFAKVITSQQNWNFPVSLLGNKRMFVDFDSMLIICTSLKLSTFIQEIKWFSLNFAFCHFIARFGSSDRRKLLLSQKCKRVKWKSRLEPKKNVLETMKCLETRTTSSHSLTLSCCLVSISEQSRKNESDLRWPMQLGRQEQSASLWREQLSLADDAMGWAPLFFVLIFHKFRLILDKRKPTVGIKISGE